MKTLTKVIIGLAIAALVQSVVVAVVISVAPAEARKCMKVEMLEAFRTGNTELSSVTKFWVRAAKLNQILRGGA